MKLPTILIFASINGAFWSILLGAVTNLSPIERSLVGAVIWIVIYSIILYFEQKKKSKITYERLKSEKLEREKIQKKRDDEIEQIKIKEIKENEENNFIMQENSMININIKIEA